MGYWVMVIPHYAADGRLNPPSTGREMKSAGHYESHDKAVDAIRAATGSDGAGGMGQDGRGNTWMTYSDDELDGAVRLGMRVL
jgi:hypothetical protein